MLKRLTDLMTPAPRKQVPTPEPIPAPAPLPDISTTIKPLLKALTSAPSLGSPEAQESLATLKQVGLKRGLYVTAFEVRTHLDLMPRVDHDGVEYQKERGYILAGDFFITHINRELQASRAKAQPLGPNIFKGYCDEMVECLIRSGHPLRAIEIPVLLLDDLLASVVDFVDQEDSYLALAQQPLLSTSTIVTQYVAHQASDTPARSAARTLTPVPRGFNAAFEPPALGFLEDLKAKFQEIRVRWGQIRGEAGSPSPFKNSLERDQALLTVANAAQYLPFCGIVKERIAGLLQQTPKAIPFLRSAGNSYETQGDLEFDLRFSKLPSKRYQRAYELYTKAGDGERASRVQAKLEKALAQRKH